MYVILSPFCSRMLTRSTLCMISTSRDFEKCSTKTSEVIPASCSTKYYLESLPYGYRSLEWRPMQEKKIIFNVYFALSTAGGPVANREGRNLVHVATSAALLQHLLFFDNCVLFESIRIMLGSPSPCGAAGHYRRTARYSYKPRNTESVQAGIFLLPCSWHRLSTPYRTASGNTLFFNGAVSLGDISEDEAPSVPGTAATKVGR